ncbi:helix-turn-helix domain-containing protein [Candidatus Woesearchaeota archaeon]|nr:helix-turn-helix domain-containing protein [Candidatus Woesearchaeota archaeon]
MEFVEQLRTYGMSEKEAKVYVSLLQIGPATANAIAEKADIVRTTTYDVLKTLKEQGIAGCIVKNKVLHYEAAEPEKLVQILEEKKRTVLGILDNLKKIKTTTTGKPKFELYEGKEGVKTVYQDILNEEQPLEAISNTKHIVELLPHYVPHFIKQRVQKGISIQLLSEETREAQEFKKNDSKELRETKYLEELKNIPITQYIYGNNVAVINTSILEPQGIIIRNKDYAKAQSQIFKILWSRANERKKK